MAFRHFWNRFADMFREVDRTDMLTIGMCQISERLNVAGNDIQNQRGYFDATIKRLEDSIREIDRFPTHCEGAFEERVATLTRPLARLEERLELLDQSLVTQEKYLHTQQAAFGFWKQAVREHELQVDKDMISLVATVAQLKQVCEQLLPLARRPRRRARAKAVKKTRRKR